MTSPNRPACLIFNPTSGRGRTARDLEAIGRSLGLEVIVPGNTADLYERVSAVAERGDPRVLVAGGDGTLQQALRALAGSSCALGIVPTGSGNDLARSLRIPLDLRRALRHALHAPRRAIDLGRVDEMAFGCVAGIGFDSEVARFANQRVKLVRGPWIYPYAVLRTVMAFRPPVVSIDPIDAPLYEGRVMLAALANAPCFGGGMRIAPDASMEDGLLDVVIIEEYPRLRLLTSVFPRVYSGRHTRHPAVHTFRTRSAHVRVDRPVEVYADGEPVTDSGPSGLKVSIDPGVAQVVAGPAVAP